MKDSDGAVLQIDLGNSGLKWRLAIELASAGQGMPPRVVLSGGGGQALGRLLGGEVQWRRDLVFEGLELAAAAAGVRVNP